MSHLAIASYGLHRGCEPLSINKILILQTQKRDLMNSAHWGNQALRACSACDRARHAGSQAAAKSYMYT